MFAKLQHLLPSSSSSLDLLQQGVELQIDVAWMT